jgi:hypothetical protein
VLSHQCIELPLLQQLGDGAYREPQGGHGGAQLEGLLHGAGGAQFVVAQADAETTGFTADSTPFATTPFTHPARSSTSFASTPLAGTLFARQLGMALLLVLGLVGIDLFGHRHSLHSGASVTHGGRGLA